MVNMPISTTWIEGREWKLVPIDATDEMKIEGGKSLRASVATSRENAARWAYHWMLTDAPTPPTPEPATHNADLIAALEPFVRASSHTRVFLTSREKIHPDGLKLFDEEVEAARTALDNAKASGSVDVLSALTEVVRTRHFPHGEHYPAGQGISYEEAETAWIRALQIVNGQPEATEPAGEKESE